MVDLEGTTLSSDFQYHVQLLGCNPTISFNLPQHLEDQDNKKTGFSKKSPLENRGREKGNNMPKPKLSPWPLGGEHH